jgi:putative DNA primase/helicase
MNQHSSKTARDIATEYVQHDWNPVPVPFKSKAPTHDGWQHRVITAADVPQYFNSHPQNIGVMMGHTSGGLTDVDLDCQESVALAPWILPKTGALFGRTSKRESHWLYRTRLGETTYGAAIQFKDPQNRHATLLELRIGAADENGEIKGCQTIFPGSVHETGEAITWDEPGEPAEVDGAELVRRAKLLAACCLLVRYWPGTGARHDTGLTLGGFFARAGYDVPKIKQLVEAIARAAGDEQVTDRIRAAADHANEFRAGKKARGFPQFRQTFGEEVARKVAEWLDYKGDYREQPGEEVLTWPNPQPLPFGLKPVDPLNFDHLPAAITPWIKDIAERMQCPPDFPAMAALVFLGSVLGRKIGICPKPGWMEVANLWGSAIGRPGAMKSPAAGEVEKPLKWLEMQAQAKYEEKLKPYLRELKLYEIKKKVLEKAAEDALKKGGRYDGELFVEKPKPPIRKRYIAVDSTYESLGVIVESNPKGFVINRDELVPLIQTLEREDNSNALGFYLSAWDGKTGYTFDRIARGHIHLPEICFSVFGLTTPGKISEHIGHALKAGSRDSGLIQRFGLSVYPDQSAEWTNIKTYPDQDAKEKAWDAFKRLDTLDPLKIGGEEDNFGKIPFLRFDPFAQAIFDAWQEDLERRLRSGELHPAFESHISKFRKIVPALALLYHIVDGGSGPVGQTATARAIALSKYLESHALRIYALGFEAEVAAAKAILGRIKRGDLKDGFSSREVWRPRWTHLGDADQAHAGLALLVDYGWLVPVQEPTNGRPKTVYRIHPSIKKEDQE